MPTASESIGEGEPWVLEVMGLPFPMADSGLGGGLLQSSLPHYPHLLALPFFSSFLPG